MTERFTVLPPLGHGHHRQCPDILCCTQHGQVGAPARGRDVGELEEHGEWKVDVGRHLGGYPAVGMEPEEGRRPSELNGRRDVLAPVDAVPGGPHDLGHVEPDAVETNTREPTPIPSPGDGDAAGDGLVMGAAEHLGCPVGITTPADVEGKASEPYVIIDLLEVETGGQPRRLHLPDRYGIPARACWVDHLDALPGLALCQSNILILDSRYITLKENNKIGNKFIVINENN